MDPAVDYDYWDSADAQKEHEKELKADADRYKRLYEDEQLTSNGMRMVIEGLQDQITAAETQIADLIYECEQAHKASDGVSAHVGTYPALPALKL